jgi:hypothetical protein
MLWQAPAPFWGANGSPQNSGRVIQDQALKAIPFFLNFDFPHWGL